MCFFPKTMGQTVNRRFIFLITLILFIIWSGNAQTIQVYEHPNEQGRSLEFDASKCSNLSDLTFLVTSVKVTHEGTCAQFYDKTNCSGSSIQVMSRHPSQNDLRDWKFDDITRSVGPCPDSCASEIIGKIPENPIDITFYNRKDFKGASETIQVHGCTHVPLKFTQQLLSVKVKGECIKLYNNYNCQPTGDNVETVEIRPGTPFHEDMSKWKLPNALLSVSLCSHKCNQTLNNVDTKSYETNDKLNEPGDVILFTRTNFEGTWKQFNVHDCTNIDNEWEGVAVSLKTFNNECVTIFDHKNCIGDSINVDTDTRNDLGRRKFEAQARSMHPCPSSGQLSPTVLILVIVVPICTVILSVFLALFFTRKCKSFKNVVNMSVKEIQQFKFGLGLNFQSGSNNDISGNYSVELLAQNQAYNDAYEIPRSKIKYDQRAILGMGEFGCVYKGSAILPSQNEFQGEQFTQVAIKTVRPNAGSQCLRSLLKEVKVMMYVGKHLRIVEMLGCCTENLLSKGEILVIMDFCPRGSLESFLAKNRSVFQNVVKKGRIDVSVNANGFDSASFQFANLEDELGEHFNFFQLLRWCHEIAEGMVFLSERKIIHSDLACRNILLDLQFQAKISDFGLSKQLYCYTEYVKKHQEPLPWRWLAIESLKSFEFSSMSDVWGYGILCWEVFTLAEKPYQGLVWGDDFVRNLEDGFRLPKPKYTISECYNLLLRCWDENPKERPTFSEIFSELEELLSSLRRVPPSCIQSNMTYSDFNELLHNAV